MDPSWEEYNDITLNTALLYKTVKNALIKANSYPLNCTSIAISAMSIDLFDSNWALYSRIYFDAILDFIAQRKKSGSHPLKKIRLVNVDEDITQILCEELDSRFPFKSY
jgi:O-acetyl-ADP-ribose deacetylase (regulator of RNase III)